ncbi:MAG: shikimate kinase [bacterium]|nr:shikimate kinase [bacterium]
MKADRPIVLVGMMGAGKTSVGRRLAARLGLPFRDSDEEIEKAAGTSITDIFERFGEEEFRRAEHRVIRRLLQSGPAIIATGGGALMNEATRDRIVQEADTVWLRADPDILLRRIGAVHTRPLLSRGDPLAILGKLIKERSPVYAVAPMVVDSGIDDEDVVAGNIIQALKRHQAR